MVDLNNEPRCPRCKLLIQDDGSCSESCRNRIPRELPNLMVPPGPDVGRALEKVREALGNYDRAYKEHRNINGPAIDLVEPVRDLL